MLEKGTYLEIVERLPMTRQWYVPLENFSTNKQRQKVPVLLDLGAGQTRHCSLGFFVT